MTTASDKAAEFLASDASAERPETRGATGDYARLRELITKDDLSDDESTEFEALAAKRRSGTLEGRPERQVTKRRSVAGEREVDDTRPRPSTASDVAAAQLLGRSS